MFQVEIQVRTEIKFTLYSIHPFLYVEFFFEEIDQRIRLGLILTDMNLTHCGRVTQICVFNTVKLGTSASSP